MMTTADVAEALAGRRSGDGWIARCPAHDDGTPSLSLREQNGRTLVKCFAGCTQTAVITALRARGLWGANDWRPNRRPFGTDLPKGGRDRTENAVRIWRGAMPAAGTVVEVYLRERGIIVPVPETLRFHGRLKHKSGLHWPAMIGLITRGTDNAPLGIQRTFLSRDGKDKAPTNPQRMMLGPCGGGAVRLGPISDSLMIGEGIETCLAVMAVTGKPAWAALSTSGLGTLNLPPEVAEVIVLADGDAPGEAAALRAAQRWQHEGRRVRIARPPRGADFNDVLLGKGAGEVVP